MPGAAQWIWTATAVTSAFFGVSGVAVGHPKRAVGFEDLPLLADPLSGLSLSSDNQRIALARNNDIVVLDVPSGKIVRDLGPGLVPIWSPDGSRLVFYSNRSGEMQVWAWDVENDFLRQITRLIGGVDADPTTRVAGSLSDALRFSWSPSSDQIVLSSRIQNPILDKTARLGSDVKTEIRDPADPLVLTTSTPMSWTATGIFAHPIAGAGIAESKDGRSFTFRRERREDDRFSQLVLVDVNKGTSEQITSGRRSWFNPVWSPDGTIIACAVIDTDGVRSDTHSSDLVLIDTRTKGHRLFATGAGLKFRPGWSPDGKELAYLFAASTLGWPRLYVAKTDPNGQTEQLSFIDRYIQSYTWARDGGSFLIGYNDGPSVRLARVNRTIGTVSELSEQGLLPLSVSDFSLSKSGAIAWRQFDPQRLSTVQYLPPRSDKRVLLASFNSEAARFALGRVEIVSWRSSNGDQKEGTILLPPGFRRGTTYPLIVDAYPLIGGTGWANPLTGNYAWASLGYVVFRPSARAPHVWMNPWTSEISSLAGKGPGGWSTTLDDVVSGIRELSRRGIVDTKKMCIHGFSNGGAVVNYLITRTNQFACAVSVSPAISDWVRTITPNHAAFVESLTGLGFERNIDDYIALSAVFHLSDVETPLLLASGDNDGAVLDAIEMYNGLRGLGKDVTLLRYPDQGHGFAGRAMADFWTREIAFFEKYLKPPH